MTREEREKAIDLLDNLKGMIDDTQGNDYDFAIKKAIETLKQEPCEDCVSRQAVFDMATTIQTDDCSGNEILEVVDINDVKTLPSVTPKAKWIPVNERLPEDRENVLFSIKAGIVFEGRFFDDKTNLQWYAYRYKQFEPNSDVTAWQSLPKPYKAGEKE